jgi:hypothetical protein
MKQKKISQPNKEELPPIPITHGEPITDRKSKFQAHLAVVHSLEEVDAVMAQLMENKKIAIATHSIL